MPSPPHRRGYSHAATLRLAGSIVAYSTPADRMSLPKKCNFSLMFEYLVEWYHRWLSIWDRGKPQPPHETALRFYLRMHGLGHLDIWLLAGVGCNAAYRFAFWRTGRIAWPVARGCGISPRTSVQLHRAD